MRLGGHADRRWLRRPSESQLRVVGQGLLSLLCRERANQEKGRHKREVDFPAIFVVVQLYFFTNNEAPTKPANDGKDARPGGTRARAVPAGRRAVRVVRRGGAWPAVWGGVLGEGGGG